MRSFLKRFATHFCFLGWATLAAPLLHAETAPAPSNESKGEKKSKGDKADKKKEKNAPKNENGLSLPIPKDHPQKGVKLPIYGSNRMLRMYFTIGTATRLNDQDVSMQDLSIQTFQETGEPDLNLEFPEAMMNVKTGDISTDTHVTIRRDDFEISGNKMIYNTNTKAGTLTNGVRMLIYDLASLNQGKKSGSKKLSVDVNSDSPSK